MTTIDRVLVLRPSGCLVNPGSYVIFRWSGCLNDQLRLVSPVQSDIFACDGAALVACPQVSTSAMDVSAEASFQSGFQSELDSQPRKKDT